jgi:tetratricopeptide (TPR) repeat protein
MAEGGIRALTFSHFRDALSDLRTIGLEQPPISPKRKHYLARRDELLAKDRRGNLTVEERVNLSEYLIRLGQYEKAVEVLTPTAAQERRNFMVFANLATANQYAGRLDRAIGYLPTVRDIWPQEWPGLSKEQLEWYRRVEKYHLDLAKLRYREIAGGAKPPNSLDNLFGTVRFVGESGQYEAGTLAAKEREKLPKDALAIVQQLQMWLPEDTRLYWLIGELYNAEGDVEAAAKIFDDCVWGRRFDNTELREHLKIVQAAKPKAGPLEFEPRAASSGQKAEPKDLDARPSWLPETKQLILVGGVAGLLVLGLVYLQVREFRRRRKQSRS